MVQLSHPYMTTGKTIQLTGPLPTKWCFCFLICCVWDSLMAQRVKRLPAMWETRVRSLGGKIPWRRKWQPTPVFLPGESHGQRSLAGYSPRGCKESNTTEQLHFHFHFHYVCQSFSSKEQVSFNFMAAVTIRNGFGAQANRITQII